MGRSKFDIDEKAKEAREIKDLAEDIASLLETLADELRSNAVVKPVPAGRRKTSPLTAQQIYDARRKADRSSGIAGFSASPAFDTLLDLHISAAAGRAVSVSSACIATGCPPTTALRWIHFLEEKGLVSLAPDPTDQRSEHVSLTKNGVAKIRKAIAHYAN